MKYIVQPGDTLFLIAQKFGVSVADIVAANNIKNPNRLDVGQQLVIPVPAQQPTLQRGSRGPAVRVLQESLTKLGYKPGPVDGIFGPLTEEAVKTFQDDWHIDADGIVGPVTWGAIAKALAAQSPPAASGIPGEPADLPAPEKHAPTEEIPYDLIVEMVPMGPAPGDAQGEASINTTDGSISVTAFNMPSPDTFNSYTTYFVYLEAPGRQAVGELKLIGSATEDYIVETKISMPLQQSRITVRPTGAGGTPTGPVVLVGRLV